MDAGGVTRHGEDRYSALGLDDVSSAGGEVHSTAPPLPGDLFQMPAAVVFHLVVALAERGEVLERGVAAMLPRDRVVDLAPGCRHPASGAHAPVGAPLRQPPQRCGGEYWLRPTERTMPVSGCVSTRIQHRVASAEFARAVPIGIGPTPSTVAGSLPPRRPPRRRLRAARGPERSPRRWRGCRALRWDAPSWSPR